MLNAQDGRPLGIAVGVCAVAATVKRGMRSRTLMRMLMADVRIVDPFAFRRHSAVAA
jgi:hypothetical protein